MVKHVPQKCNEAECVGCRFCHGGLIACTVCGGAEASLTTDCPETQVSEARRDKVQEGKLEFFHGSGGFKSSC